MLKLLLSPQAEIDLEEIYDYTLITWNLSQAEKYHDDLYASFEMILSNPEIGSVYYYKKGNYRKLNSKRHLIFFRTAENYCYVIRILHERIDLITQFE